MSCIKYLNSYDEVKAVVAKIQEKRIPAIMGCEPLKHENYRGQVSDTFFLRPNLARYFYDIETFTKVEYQLMDDFKSEMLAMNKIDKLLLHNAPLDFQNEWAWLGQAQHYRLPTRMMDWTDSWEVALYFAVEDDPDFNSHAAQFWIFYVPDEKLMHDSKRELYYKANPYIQKNTWMINPSFFWSNNYENETAEIRRARQHGKFSVQSHLNILTPLERQSEIIPNLEKYCIPANVKGLIRLELASNGIFGDFLYEREDEEINNIISSLRAKYRLI